MLIGASLSEPHTSVNALRTRVCIWLAMDQLQTDYYCNAQGLYTEKVT